MLEGLTDVQLLEDRTHGRIVEVDRHEVHVPIGPWCNLVALGLQKADLIDVGQRHVPDARSLTAADRVDLGRCARERHLLELGDLRLVRARVLGIRDEYGVAGGVEALQVPRTIDDLPGRVGGVGGEVLVLALEVLVDRFGAGRSQVCRAGGAARGCLVPRQRKRGYLRELVVEEPLMVIDLVQGESNRGRVDDLGGSDVVRVRTRNVAAEVGLVRLDQVLPELDITSRHLRAVGPHPVLERDRDRAAIRGPNGWVADRPCRVGRQHRAPVPDPVQRHEHQLRELVQVYVRVLGRTEQGKDRRRWRRRRQREAHILRSLRRVATRAAAGGQGQRRECEGDAGGHQPSPSAIGGALPCAS